MVEILSVETSKRVQLIDITDKIKNIVKESGVKNGLCNLYVPHTTAAITINENADPSVVIDISERLSKIVPYHSNYRHAEGNADAHIKSTITGINSSCFIENGDIMLGTWQGIFFCEYDGPRTRKVFVKITEG